MSPAPGPAHRALIGLALASLAVAAAFAAAVLSVPGDPLALHESSGAILLVLIGAIVVLSARTGSGSRPLLPWAIGALVALLVMGATGALLATDNLPQEFSFLPLVPLVALGLLLVGLLWRARSEPERAARPSSPDP